jgi:XTP/dITP diphosphohydrolase
VHHLLIATHNAHKTRELAELLGIDFEISDLRTMLDLDPVEETGHTFEENACLKAIAASQHTRVLVLADDSGLEVEALGGAPGVYSARYAGPEATDAGNIAKLLRELRRVDPEGANRDAQFRCVLALARGGKMVGIFDGIVKGHIIDSPRGENGFGYDPVFVPLGHRETFAELGDAVKNQISHRAAAIAELRQGWPKLCR